MARKHEPIWNRVNPVYFRRLPPFRAVKRWLSFVLAFGAIGWVAALAVREDERPFDSGPPSRAHRLFAADCFKCHVDPWRGVKQLTANPEVHHSLNKACLNCHAASIAYDQTTMIARHVTHDDRGGVQEPAQACAACHREHQGDNGLLDIDDAHCIRCHADLRAIHAATDFASSVRAFAVDHPEFRLIKDGAPDPGRIKLNHAVHLKAGLLGPGRTPVQMTCGDCHRMTGDPSRWPYQQTMQETATVDAATSSGHPVDTFENKPVLTDDGAVMQPIRYALHCAACHPLAINDPVPYPPGGLIPHESPQRIRLFLRGKLTTYVNAHPEALHEETSADKPRLPTLRRSVSETERLKTAWVEERIETIERMIYRDRKDCLLCHEQDWSEESDGLPRIISPSVPQRWFTHASFSHERHRILTCTACHGAASGSTKTADVLLPGIALCRTCHAPALSRSGGADDRCIVCHRFHQSPGPAAPAAGVPLDALTTVESQEVSTP